MLVHVEVALTLLSSPAGIQCTVVSTERGNHARGALEALPAEELARFDGVVAVGGDGLFQETLNALLTLRCAPLLRPRHSKPVYRVPGRRPCWPGSDVCGSACQDIATSGAQPMLRSHSQAIHIAMKTKLCHHVHVLSSCLACGRQDANPQ